MGYTIRVGLTGYNALTDTNPDHYALYTDGDNILVKEKARGTIDISAHSGDTVAHGLPYIPLSFGFIEISSGVWRRIYGQTIVADYEFQVDDTYLYFHNGSGSEVTFSYYIFYDQLTSGSETITESNYVLKASKAGVNALSSTNPNDYIFHSDLNTFKIVDTGVKEISLTGYTSDQTFTEAHGLSFIPLVNAFANEDTVERVFPPNSPDIYFWGPKAGWFSTGITFNYVQADATNVIFNLSNSAETQDVNIRYYCLEKI